MTQRMTQRHRHCTLAIVLAVLAHGAAIGAQGAAPRNFRVTLLGTGAPPPSVTRFGPSILVEAGDQTLVFDAGRGASQRLEQLGVPFSGINAVFLTHLHSDHVVGLPDLWLSGWIISRRTVPWELLAPRVRRQWPRISHKPSRSTSISERRKAVRILPVDGSQRATSSLAWCTSAVV